MIQLKDTKGNVLYELEKSTIFPDYPAVLAEALAIGVNLNGLSLHGQNLDNLLWKGVKATSLSFTECSLQKSRFEDCEIEHFSLNNCDCSGIKFRDSLLIDAFWEGSNFQNASFNRISASNHFIIESKLESAHFADSNLIGFSVHSTNLCTAIFENCKLDDSYFVSPKKEEFWLKDALFLKCSMLNAKFHKIEDISNIYFWETNIREIDFSYSNRLDEPTIVKIENNLSTVVYCVETDTLWWKPYSWNEKPYKIFRSNLQGFIDEVQHDFPTTDLYPDMGDLYIKHELKPVYNYLKVLRKEYKSLTK